MSQLSEVTTNDHLTNEASMPETISEEKKDEGATAEDPKLCRNIVLTGFGGLKMVKVQKKPEPKPGNGEVLIKVKAW